MIKYMKRFIGLLLLSFFIPVCLLAAVNYSNKTINKTVTLGKSFTITPYIDLGIPQNAMTGSAEDAPDYIVSDASAFSIVSTPVFTVNSQGNKFYPAYKHTLTPQKTGFYTFSQVVPWYYNWYECGDAVMTYNITVVDVTSISMASTMFMYVGSEELLVPTIAHVDAETTLTWNSSNTSVATVSSEGRITGISVGTTTITVTAHNGVSAKCVVTVNPVMTSGITLNVTETEMVVGEKLNLTATVAPSNATNKSVTWSSTNEAVAVVSESGQVTAVGSGTCQVKATANDGSGKSASCLITVEKNNKLTVTDMTQCSGGRGVLNVLLSDEETIMGFQFDLQLPTGVTVAEKDGKLLAALTGNAVNTHSISSSKVSDGLYRFVVTPQGSRAISQANGDGMTITIDVADNVAVGTYTMTIKDIEMTVKKTGNVYEDIHPKNSTATLTITEAVMGDVNGDGRVSVTDVISMNSYILEEEPAQFIRKVADLNGDGKVTITDLVQVIDIILGR